MLPSDKVIEVIGIPDHISQTYITLQGARSRNIIENSVDVQEASSRCSGVKFTFGGNNILLINILDSRCTTIKDDNENIT